MADPKKSGKEDEFEVVDSSVEEQLANLRQEMKILRRQCLLQTDHRSILGPAKRLFNFCVLLLLILMALPVIFIFFLLQFRWILHCPPLPDSDGLTSDMMTCELLVNSASPTFGYFLNCMIMLIAIGIANLIVCSFLYIWSALLAFDKEISTNCNHVVEESVPATPKSETSTEKGDLEEKEK